MTQISSSGTNYISSLAYNSAWQATGFNYGNGVAASFGYNSRMQLASLAYTKSGSTLFSLNYDYATGIPGNNGQIQKITGNVDATRTSTIVYDGWLRLKSWTNSQATVTETYDRYGNRLTQSLPVPSTIAVDATTNQITTSGFAYDAAGNMTNDSINALTYDGENRVITSTQSGATYNYSYDGNGLRVQKTPPTGSATVYIFSGSKVIAEYASGAALASPSSEYIYSGSQLIATLAGGATTYHHTDHLSARVSTDSNGNMVRSFGHYPFGETWYETGTASKWKFTSYERDSESSLDHTQFRQYSSQFGRWMHPDPAGLAAVDPANPQSWNRYAYVLNNPLRAVDPLGLDCIYLTDGGDSIESIDQTSDASECGGSGGYWVDGLATQVYINPDGTGVSLVGTDGTNGTSAIYNLTQGSGSGSWSIWDTIRSMLPPLSVNVSWLAGPIVPGAVHWGPTVQVTYIPQSDKTCVSGGLAVGTPGKSFNFGPLVLGDVNNAEAILKGFSWGGNIQTTPATGAQDIQNLSGRLGGPTGGTPGGSFSGTYGACFGGKK